MPFYINKYIYWLNNKIWLNGQLTQQTNSNTSTDILVELYQHTGISYPKFFKMDLASRVAFLASELLAPFPEQEQNSTAVVMSTYSGCIEVDKKFEESRRTIASPSLFVYTLPNIMLGEVCIRHGFKGEQICMINQEPEWEEMEFIVQDQLQYRAMETCLCGHIEATDQHIEASLAWITRIASDETTFSFSASNLKKAFQKV